MSLNVFDFQVGDRVVVLDKIPLMEVNEGDLGVIFSVDDDGEGVYVIWDRYVSGTNRNYSSRVWWVGIHYIRLATILDEITGWFENIWRKFHG